MPSALKHVSRPRCCKGGSAPEVLPAYAATWTAFVYGSTAQEIRLRRSPNPCQRICLLQLCLQSQSGLGDFAQSGRAAATPHRCTVFIGTARTALWLVDQVSSTHVIVVFVSILLGTAICYEPLTKQSVRNHCHLISAPSSIVSFSCSEYFLSALPNSGIAVLRTDQDR